MAAVIVRRRLGSRSAKLRYQANRWYWRHRTTLAVTAVFVTACVLGMTAASIGLKGVGLGSTAHAAITAR